MTPQEIRIAVAEEMDFSEFQEATNNDGRPLGFLQGRIKHGPLLPVPDYPFDLNAMREVEDVLNGDWYSYFQHLRAICDRDLRMRMQTFTENESLFGCIHATALQRAEAFLRVKGKWRE